MAGKRQELSSGNCDSINIMATLTYEKILTDVSLTFKNIYSESQLKYLAAAECVKLNPTGIDKSTGRDNIITFLENAFKLGFTKEQISKIILTKLELDDNNKLWVIGVIAHWEITAN